MKIVRFHDENNEICYGEKFGDNSADLLSGNIFEGLVKTGKKVTVKKLISPLKPSVIMCIGLNYRKHAEETGMKSPNYPVLFMKNPASITHPGHPIKIPPFCLDPPQVDYEVELAVVIGKKAKNVPAHEALEYVLGYTIANDVSARHWQKHAGGGQWVRGKSFDTFCPLGPVLITADELMDPQKLNLRCYLNGQLMQDGNTADMIFSVAELIGFLSESTTLAPGTVILTGTPSGVGYTRKPPVYLKPGDIVHSEIDRIGELVNPVV